MVAQDLSKSVLNSFFSCTKTKLANLKKFENFDDLFLLPTITSSAGSNYVLEPIQD